jgi:hypothetical protein
LRGTSLPVRVLAGLEPRPIIAAKGNMKIRVSNPRAVEDLRAALQAADCATARVGDDTLDVELGWADGDARQARLELTFFVRAWASQHPGASALVEA